MACGLLRVGLLYVTAALLAIVTAASVPEPLNVTALHTFEYPSWLENLAIRSNGEILTTRLDIPILYQVDHLTGNAVEVATWNASQYSGALGISEGAMDVFFVILCAFYDESTFVKTSGVNSIFKVDLNGFVLGANGSVASGAVVTHLVDIPEADYLNGMATLDVDHIYVSDVYSGVIYLVDVSTGSYEVAVSDALTKFSVANESSSPNLGANGLKVHDNYLYWTNTAGGFLARAPVDPATGLVTGSSAVVVTDVPRPDDFQVTADGTFFIAQNQEDTLSRASSPDDESKGPVAAEPIAGSNISTILAGVTSPKFGRTSTDGNRLYLSTSGGLALPINGSITVAGTISYVDIE